MRVAVTGGRDFNDWATIWEALSVARRFAHLDTLLVGDCPTGADRWAMRWARFYRVPGVMYVARWAELGKRAGPERNARMITRGKPELLIAFPGGPGTANCVATAGVHGVPVCHVTPPAVPKTKSGP